MRGVNMPQTMCSDSVRLVGKRIFQHEKMKNALVAKRALERERDKTRKRRLMARAAERRRAQDAERAHKRARITNHGSVRSELPPSFEEDPTWLPEDLSDSDEDDDPFDTGTNDIFDQNLNPFLRLRF